MKNIEGFDELDDLLRLLPANVSKRVLQKSINAGARKLKANVKRVAPVWKGERSPASKKYGRLKQKINMMTLKRLKNTRGMKGAKVSIGTAFYGYFLEFGTRYVRARPWFRPAVFSSEKEIVDVVSENLLDGVESEAKKLYKR